MKRTAFVLLPFWPTDRWRQRRPDAQALAAGAETPFVLTEQSKSALRLSALDPTARRLGLAPGMPLSDARAQVPGLVHAARPFLEERADLERLARWCMRFSPFVAPVHAVFDAHGLVLDVTGMAGVFGEEAVQLQALLAGMRGLGLHARAALADTPGLAAALAGFDPRAEAGFVSPPGAGLAGAAHLPAASLRLPSAMAGDLGAVGLKTVGDCTRVARASLARRFGPALITRLDQAAGDEGEPIDPIAPATRLFAVRRLLHPATTLEALSQIARDLCTALSGDLIESGLGARVLRLDLFNVDGRTTEIGVGFARAETAPGRLARILVERMERALEGRDLGFGVEAALLTALRLERPSACAIDLDPAAARRAQADAALAGLLDTLRARLGRQGVSLAVGRQSHWPERAEQRAASSAGQPGVSGRADRPLFLLARPEPIEAIAEIPDGPPRSFRWRRVNFRVARAEGPERIGAEWWRAPGSTRDYFRVETGEGRRLWLFREGLYGAETHRPRWYVHGAFA